MNKIFFKKCFVKGAYISATILYCSFYSTFATAQINSKGGRQEIVINDGWKFYKYDSKEKADKLIYDVRPEVKNVKDDIAADSKPTAALRIKATNEVLKPWILPSGNDFIKNRLEKHVRPKGNPGADFPFVQPEFNDSLWEDLDLPHDWAIKGPFYKGWDTPVGGSMGRLPVQGVAWYRKKINIPKEDIGKTIYLNIDGAMSYAMVWLNGKLVGGWPFGYTSWSLDITPYVKAGVDNQLAIRLDNPPNSSRWYPGAGIYRKVSLTKVNRLHVKQWGTYVTTRDIRKESATVDLSVSVKNNTNKDQAPTINTEIYLLDKQHKLQKLSVDAVAVKKQIIKGGDGNFKITFEIKNPKLWNPLPSTEQNRYVAITTISSEKDVLDVYKTYFGIRDVKFDADKGIMVNDKSVYIKGVNQHHDLGALGAAFNLKAARRQLELLKEMGCNAIRLAHNPPAPELLDLTDEMGFLVVNEIYDCWEMKKSPLDFHLIFPDWYEQDLRALVRRDKNHPSVILWSFGNEVGEQYNGEEGAKLAAKLKAIVKDEDPSRLTTVSMNYAKPHMPFAAIGDVINLNYQGEGIRHGIGYENLKGISTPPLYEGFRSKFPDKVIISSENAATLSSRGEYLFPVTSLNSAPAKDNDGLDPKTKQVSAYELYSVEFGSSADRVFKATEKHPFVAGGFVWSGWDYLGEPTPNYLAKSSYFGIIDLAGFKKDRFYQYQAHWKPDFPMVHILPHWTWPEREGLITPVHIFTSGDEVELFLNGESLGKKKKEQYEYRLRWDSVMYRPGELRAVAYKNGKKWAESSVRTVGTSTRLSLSPDVDTIVSDGEDLVFVTANINDNNNQISPRAKNEIKFSLEGPGQIVATDNGDPTDLTSFISTKRKAFNGLALVIIKARRGQEGKIKLKAESEGLEPAELNIAVIGKKNL